MKLNPFMFFSFLVLKHPWKIFNMFHLFFLFFGLDTYKHAKKVNCMYLSSQRFFKTLEWNSKIPRKFKKNDLYSDLQT